MKTDVFLPPGVQVRLADRFGAAPRQATPRTAAKISALWSKRNQVSESDIAGIDAAMEALIVADVRAERSRRPRSACEYHDLHGHGRKRCRVWIMPVRSRRNYWASVTDVRCPSCAGIVRWYEAGFVPGYRKCDQCARTFLAAGTVALPKLILDAKR